jgi:hypothetical protein
MVACYRIAFSSHQENFPITASVADIKKERSVQTILATNDSSQIP